MCRCGGERVSDTSKAQAIFIVLLSLFPSLNSTGQFIKIKN